MVKWLHVTKKQYLGFWACGLVFFILQKLPYIVMPLIPLETNPLMEMQDRSMVLNAIEKTRSDAKCFSIDTVKEKIYLGAALLALTGYFTGWIFYYNGFQSLPLMLCSLVALPPLYYSFIGLWRRNYLLTALGGMFLIAHIANVWNNLK